MEAVAARRYYMLWGGLGIGVLIGAAALWMKLPGAAEVEIQDGILQLQAEVPIEGTLVFSGARHPTDHVHHLWLIRDKIIHHLEHRGGGPILAKDGTHLFFQAEGDLYRMELSSRKVERLGVSDVAFISDYDVSPDGNRVCFTVVEADNAKGVKGYNVHVADLDGDNLRILTNFLPDHLNGVNHPKWSPNGMWILFSATDPKKSHGKWHVRLWRIHTEDLQLEKILLPTMIASIKEASWSPDGKKIVFSATPSTPPGKNFEIFTANVDGSGLQRLTSNDWNEREPIFSPDGNQVCFVSYRHRTVGAAGYGSELYLINTDGTNERRLTPPQKVEYRRARGGWAEDHHPTWAP